MVIPKDEMAGGNVECRGISAGVSEVMAACSGGLQAVLGDHVGLVLSGEGATTLGESCEFALGLVGACSGSGIGMGEQVCTMAQRFLESQ
jgi:hypothetical protein